WSLFDSRSVKPTGTNAYNNYPNFAVVPRSTSYTPADPSPPDTSSPPKDPTPPVEPPPPSTPPPPVSAWRQPGKVTLHALDMLDGVAPYFEVLPVRLPYQFVHGIKTQAAYFKSSSEQAPKPAIIAPHQPVDPPPAQPASKQPTPQQSIATDCPGCVIVISREASEPHPLVKCTADDAAYDREISLAHDLKCREDRLRR
ncbi:hypothetical protein, partial [Rhodanobacter lindaniclasticus]